MGTFANIVDPLEMLQDVAFHQLGSALFARDKNGRQRKKFNITMK